MLKAKTIFASLSGALILLTSFFISFDGPLELKSRDLRSQIAGRADFPSSIVVVTIDDESFHKLDLRWPWPRDIFSKAIDYLSESDARVIALDIALSERDFSELGDKLLSESFAKAGNVIVPSKREHKETETAVLDYMEKPIDMLAESAHASGYVNLLLDKDGFIRRMVPYEEFNGERIYSFALRIAEKVEAGIAKRIPLNPDGSIHIDYAAPKSLKKVPFYSLLDGSADPKLFQDAIVLIGAGFKESHDIQTTPVESQTGLYGVEIHANIVKTILYGRSIHILPQWKNSLFSILILVLSVLVFFRFTPGKNSFLLLIAISAYILLSQILFSQHQTYISLIRPLSIMVFTWILSLLFNYVQVEKDKIAIRRVFSRFVSEKVVNTLLKNKEIPTLGGEIREIVIFFSDICSFTSLSEESKPREVVDMLNSYFTEMSDVIYRQEGTLNKYIGDAIMAFYGAPLRLENPAKNAVLTALEMRDRLKEYNAEREKNGKAPIAIGMGIHMGEVLVGNIGSPKQMEYTVIGDPVNAASRLEGLTRQYNTDLIVSGRIAEKVSSLVKLTSLGSCSVKGKKEKIDVFTVEGLIDET